MIPMTAEGLEALKWIRSRPPAVQDVMKQFPPSCVVKANRRLLNPAPGQEAVIMSYIEGNPMTVRVMDETGANKVAAECQLDWLEVVRYTGNITPEFIEKVLAGEDIEPIWVEA